MPSPIDATTHQASKDYADRKQARRAVVSLFTGLFAGLIVAGLTEIPRLSGPANVRDFIANAFNFFGGRLLAGIALAVLAVATLWWISMWGFSPFTLEGWWLYTLAMTAGTGAFLLLRRRRTGAWDEPSG